MTTRIKYALVLAGCLIFLGLGFGLIVAAVWADFQPHEKALLADALVERIGLVVFMLMIASVAIGLALRAAFDAYVHPPLKLAEETRVLLHTNHEHRLSHAGGGEFLPLVQAVNQLADQRNGLERDVEEKIREGRLSMEEERNRLAALMSELTQSVVVCNLDGRILLYNNRARLQFRALADISPSEASTFIGLGRSIFAIFERNLITHALENIQQRLKRGGSQPVANFVTTTRAGQLIRVQMAPVLGGAETPEGGRGESDRPVTGYVLMLDNITRSFVNESVRDRLLQSLTEGSRASLANIRAAVENLMEYPDMDAAQRDRFQGIIGEEARNLSQSLDRTVHDYADSLKARWPLEEMLGADLIAAAQRRIERRLGLRAALEGQAENVWIKVDSFSLLQSLSFLASRLNETQAVRAMGFRLAPAGRLVHLDLIWSGAALEADALAAWEAEPMNLAGEESTPLSLRDVVERHGGEIWLQREEGGDRSFFRLLLPAAAPQETVDAATLLRGESRPEYYDFDLFRQTGEYSELDDRLLSELTYTVFDTETTGLEPSAGDEIIQLGAVRIVNGRLLRQEIYDQLVDPRRHLRRESRLIHGITEEMLRGQPTIDKVLPAFHAFCEDTVLVAHNAAFDMRFLQLKEEATGVRFTQPVLDTLLLSPILHPNLESHRLEAIAELLGVPVLGRHTALGDAMVTAEVFLKMIPLLAEQGIRSLREAREAAQKSYYARIQY